MTGSSTQEDSSPGAKRRKVRKGTQSCWECRRRKVRCVFATPTDTICDHCERRGTTCVSQELPDTPTLSTGNNQIVARLGRVEHLIERLVNGANAVEATASVSCSSCSSSSNNSNNTNVRTFNHLNPRFSGNLIPQKSTLLTRAFTPPRSPLKRPLPVTSKHEDVSRALTAAWPSKRELEIVYSLPVGLSAHLHCGICKPYSSSVGLHPPSARDMLQLPPTGSHPVLIARKLLELGTFLQGALPSSVQDLETRGFAPSQVMSDVVDIAIRLVTTNEDLIGSVEGIECILLEALYQNYAGNLHKAWMAVRRAVTVAQMMALHRGRSSPSLKILDPETRAAFDPDHICFRLTEMDRYLSLMLGLPQASLNTRFSSPQALEECQSVDRMQRIHCVVAGRILQRDGCDAKNLAVTLEIDKLLQRAAAEMSPQWWLMPDLRSDKSDGTVILHEMIRLMDQFSSYHLLIRLHLPYMLHPSPDRRYDHSRITAVNASRETLTRYVAFRTSNPTHYYCRGSDFLAFISTTVLCLAHISFHSSQRPGVVEDLSSDTIFSFLAHNRPSDRGLMERTLNVIESMAKAGTDAIASKIAHLLGQLLAIENNAASGVSYDTSSSKGEDGDFGCDGELTDDGNVLHVHVPYFGTIKIERGSISRAGGTGPATAPPVQDVSTAPATNILPSNQVGECGSQQLRSELGYLSAGELDNYSVHLRPQGTTSQHEQSGSLTQQPENGISSGMHGNDSLDDTFLPFQPSDFIGTQEAHWDLQGVDVTLFDSLFHGSGAFNDLQEQSCAFSAGDV